MSRGSRFRFRKLPQPNSRGVTLNEDRVEPRFFRALGPFRLGDLAELCAGRLHDASQAGVEVWHAATLSAGKAGDITFAASAARLKSVSAAATCVIAPPDAAGDIAALGPAVMVAEDPQLAFAICADALFELRRVTDGFSAETATRVDPSARIANGAVVGPGAQVGAGVRIEPNAVIGPNVTIGSGTLIGATAVIMCADIGADCVISSGAVVGEVGYGLAASGGAAMRQVPQLGRVVIEDAVTLGANSTVDRAAFGVTRIGAGTKIDNLVQIGHNCQIGRHCVIAGCCGVSGSVVMGDGAMLGGGVGVKDHVVIGQGAQIAGGSALVSRDIPAGELWSGGVPAKPLRQFYRELAALARLGSRPDRT